VFVNGEAVSPLDIRNPQRDITPYLTTGENSVEVQVPSTMWNYLRSISDELENGGVGPQQLSALGAALPPLTENGLVGTMDIVPSSGQF
jgi:hypothetical protein